MKLLVPLWKILNCKDGPNESVRRRACDICDTWFSEVSV